MKKMVNIMNISQQLDDPILHILILDAENVFIKRVTRGIPSSAIMRKSVVMGTVWIFKPTRAYKFSKLCISRMVERFGKDDCNWEHIDLTFKVSSHS
jgi:hypothetical protein